MSRQISIGRNAEDWDVSIPEDALKQHTVVFGGSGFGKTYFSYVAIAGH